MNSACQRGVPLASRAVHGGLRDELAQPSLTQYNRPGKIPGVGRAAIAAREAEAAEAGLHGGAGGLGKHKSLVNRNLQLDEPSGPLARMGSEVALARTAAGVSMAAEKTPAVASARSFTSSNNSFARKLAGGVIAQKVSDYVKGRLPQDDDMEA